MSTINNSSMFNTNGRQDFLNAADLSLKNMLKSDKGPTSSSDIFKNINVFDVLTPEVDNVQISSNNNEGFLIDITNDTDYDNGKSKHSLDSNELRGSLADVKKTEFNLIDLYENIYVTPQHVAKEQLCTNTTKEINDFCYNNSDLINHDNQFRISDKRSEKEHENLLKSTSKPRQYDEIFDKIVSSKSTTINSDNLAMQNNASISKTPSFNTVIDMRNDSREDPEDLIQDMLHMNILQNQMLKKLKRSETEKKCHCSFVTGNSNKMINEVPMKMECPKEGILAQKHSDFTVCDLENVGKLCSMSNAMGKVIMLDTVKKDEKTAKSKKNSSHSPCSSNLTKGPDIFEKSVVLPQIMQRIAERNKRITEKNNQNLRKKLLLDTGNVDYNLVGALDMKTKRHSKKRGRKIIEDTNMLPPCSMTTDVDCPDFGSRITREEVTLNPTVLMENSKIVRLAAFEQRRKFENFVFTGKFDK